MKFTPSEYRTMLEMSSSGKYLLVEGRSDKRLFQALLYEVFNKVTQNISLDNIIINSAEDIIETDKYLDNRQKVELVCNSVQGTSLASKLIGFVDREFREFDINDVPEDKLNRHNSIDGVIWSRGHSIENYCFDFSILDSPLREHSDIDRFDLALNLFKKIFDSVLSLACAISLAAAELGKLQRVCGRTSWQTIEINQEEVKLRPDVLKHSLVHRPSKGGLTVEEYNHLIECFDKWLERIERADLSCIRWLCHGHIGMSFIWAAYGQCVYVVCKDLGIEHPESEVRKVLEAKESGRFRTCISSWIRRSLDNTSEYPREILKFFDLLIPHI